MLAAQGHLVADERQGTQVCPKPKRIFATQRLRLSYLPNFTILKMRFWACGYLVNFLLLIKTTQ